MSTFTSFAFYTPPAASIENEMLIVRSENGHDNLTIAFTAADAEMRLEALHEWLASALALVRVALEKAAA